MSMSVTLTVFKAFLIPCGIFRIFTVGLYGVLDVNSDLKATLNGLMEFFISCIL